MIRSKPFKDYATARRALDLARIVVPDSNWYMTNESGEWQVIEYRRNL